MSFTYDPATLSTSLHHLRFLVQDTVEEGHFLEDEEITFAASQEANIYRAAAGLCRAIAARFAQMPGHDGEIVLKSEDKAKTYLAMAEHYDAKADAADASMKNDAAESLSLPPLPSRPASFTRGLGFSDE